MSTAVIVEAVRPPVGKRNGGRSEIQPADLRLCTKGAGRAVGLDSAIVEDGGLERRRPG
jgi:hypothetical protein